MPRAPKPVITDQGINFGLLGDVCSAQLEADGKYDREDAAKFRAVAQKVPTYEDFENMVIGSHLKPMKEDVTDLTLGRSAWDTTGRSKTRARRRDKTAGMGQQHMGLPKEAPPTVQKFMRDWRRNCPALLDKYNYLLLCGPTFLTDMFKVEVPDGQLGPFFVALNEGYSSKDALKVKAILEALKTTGRYKLAVDFMMDNEEAAHMELLTKLANKTSGGDGSAGEAVDGEDGAVASESVPTPQAPVQVLHGGALEEAAKQAAAAAVRGGGDGGSGGSGRPMKVAPSPRRIQIVSDDDSDSDDESDSDSELPPLEEIDLQDINLEGKGAK